MFFFQKVESFVDFVGTNRLEETRSFSVTKDQLRETYFDGIVLNVRRFVSNTNEGHLQRHLPPPSNTMTLFIYLSLLIYIQKTYHSVIDIHTPLHKYVYIYIHIHIHTYAYTCMKKKVSEPSTASEQCHQLLTSRLELILLILFYSCSLKGIHLTVCADFSNSHSRILCLSH